jgi:hypothetical protein
MAGPRNAGGPGDHEPRGTRPEMAASCDNLAGTMRVGAGLPSELPQKGAPGPVRRDGVAFFASHVC